MGRVVLAKQSLAVLYPELKGTLAGQEGTFDQLLAWALFKESKQRFLEESGRRVSPRSFTHRSYPSSQA